MLFEYDYSDAWILEFSTWLDMEWNEKHDLKFLFPHGFCNEIDFSINKKFFFLKTKKNRKVLLVDPNRKNKLRTEENFESWLSIGPTKNGLYEAANYEVSLEIHDDKINNGITCTDYASMGSTYGECIENAVKDQLLKWYGCLPVWFSPAHDPLIPGNSTKSLIPSIGHNLTCVLPIKPYQSYEIKQTIIFQLWHLVVNQDLDCMKACLPPCLTMKIKPKLMTYRENFKENAQLEIVWSKNVVMTKSAYSFESFDLVVELGSSLGLWLGLSAINILDVILTYGLKFGQLSGVYKNSTNKSG